MQAIIIELIKILKVPIILLTIYGLFSITDLKNGITEIIITLKSNGVKEITIPDVATIKMTDDVIKDIEKKLPPKELEKIENDINKLRAINDKKKTKIVEEASKIIATSSIINTENDFSLLTDSYKIIKNDRSKSTKSLKCYSNLYSEEEIKAIFEKELKELRINNYYQIKKDIQVIDSCKAQSSNSDLIFYVSKDTKVKIKEIINYFQDSYFIKLEIDERDVIYYYKNWE